MSLLTPVCNPTIFTTVFTTLVVPGAAKVATFDIDFRRNVNTNLDPLVPETVPVESKRYVANPCWSTVGKPPLSTDRNRLFTFTKNISSLSSASIEDCEDNSCSNSIGVVVVVADKVDGALDVAKKGTAENKGLLKENILFFKATLADV